MDMRFETKLIVLLILPVAAVAVLFYAVILPPDIARISPAAGEKNIGLDSSVVIHFDKPVKRAQLEHTIEPNTFGTWKFEDSVMPNHLYRTLVFTPVFPLRPATAYKISLKNIANDLGIGLTNSFSFSFTTKESVAPEVTVNEIVPSGLALAAPVPAEPMMTILDVPMHFQEHSLSCEAASLKMALNFKGVGISENTIMGKIGYDLSPRKNNVWGDPNRLFIGNIDGISCKTGYGVYWNAVAEAAKNWRNAESFTKWDLGRLISEVRAGNPVLVWGTIPVKNPTDCSWRTPEGAYIRAFKETHVRVVIGYIGPAAKPEKIILNDPLSGTVYWNTDYFMKNWKIFDYSGVVIR